MAVALEVRCVELYALSAGWQLALRNGECDSLLVVLESREQLIGRGRLSAQLFANYVGRKLECGISPLIPVAGKMEARIFPDDRGRQVCDCVGHGVL